MRRCTIIAEFGVGWTTVLIKWKEEALRQITYPVLHISKDTHSVLKLYVFELCW